MSVAGKRSFAVAVAELRLGCDLVREAHAGPTGTAAERQDPLYIWAVQHDDHATRQKLEAGWQRGMRQEVRMICAARAMAQALQVSIAGQMATTMSDDNTVGALTASMQKGRIDSGNGDGIRVRNELGVGWCTHWRPSDSTPQVTYAESEDEYGEDEDADWQGRSPVYPHVAWERKQRRAHVTNLLGGQWQLHTNDVMGNWN